MTLKELKELIEQFDDDDLELPLKTINYMPAVDIELHKTNYLGHECIIIDVY